MNAGRILLLGPLDWIIVALFLGLILLLGFSAKVRNSSVLQFLAAGRTLSLPAFIATLVSTWYGGILGVGESVSYYGVGTWLLLGVPYYAFALVFALWFSKRIRQGDQISLPERFESAWGKPVAVLGAILLFCLAVPAAHVLMLGTLLRALTGWPIALAVIVATLGGTLFLYRGGLLADVRVSFAAFLMMYVGFASMLVYCLIRFPMADALQKLDPPMRTVTGGQGWVVIVSFFLLGAWTLVDPGFHQRAASVESPSVGRKGVLLSIVCWFVFDMLSMGVALYALAYLKPFPAGEPLSIYPAFAQQVLPPGLKAVFVCGMLGTILSAMVGYTLVSGATIGREVVARMAKVVDDDRVTQWTRFGMFVSCLCAVGLGLLVGSVVNLWYAWGGAVTGSLLLPVCLAYLGRKNLVSPLPMAISIISSFGTSVGWMIWCGASGNSQYELFFLKLGEHWRLFWSSPSKELAARAKDTFTAEIGTLLPGLVISAIIIGAGILAQRRQSHD